MQEGRSYYVYAPSGHSGTIVPEIREIKVNNRKGFIEMQVTGHDSIRWISCGEVVHRGEKISLNELPEVKKYVRAEVFGAENTILGTQPFGIRENE